MGKPHFTLFFSFKEKDKTVFIFTLILALPKSHINEKPICHFIEKFHISGPLGNLKERTKEVSEKQLKFLVLFSSGLVLLLHFEEHLYIGEQISGPLQRN